VGHVKSAGSGHGNEIKNRWAVTKGKGKGRPIIRNGTFCTFSGFLALRIRARLLLLKRLMKGPHGINRKTVASKAGNSEISNEKAIKIFSEQLGGVWGDE